MSTISYRAIIEQARQKFNSGDVSGYIEALYAPDAVFHFFPPNLPQGHAGAKLFYGSFVAAFPDAQFTPDDMIVEGDCIAIRYHLDMTHRGEFQGVPPTGKQVTLTGITLMRFVNDRVVERWNESDFLGLLIQLGAIPAPAPA